MPPRSVDSVQSASVTAAAICALSCELVGVAVATPGCRKTRRYCCQIVVAWTAAYPFLAMQADQAPCALRSRGSLITSPPISLSMLSIPASDVANWALLKSVSMFWHLFSAACTATGKLDGEPINRDPPPSGTLKPDCSACERPM